MQMYCSNCGKIINKDLSFCNHCGFRLPGKETEQMTNLPLSSFNFLVAAMIGVPIAGTGVIIALLSVMKRGLGFGDEMIGAVILMSFILLMIAEVGLLWLLWMNTRKKKDLDGPVQRPLSGRDDVVIKGLPESSIDPVASTPYSVTDETTRTLDAVPRK